MFPDNLRRIAHEELQILEVGGKGAGKVDLLHISQAKHIWCIYTQIRQKHKNIAKKSNKMYYPSIKLILAHFWLLYG